MPIPVQTGPWPGHRLIGIHSDSRPRYPDGMSATDSINSERRRLSIGLPRPLWIAVAIVVLIVVAVGLRIGIPIYRHQAAIRQLQSIGGVVVTERGGPAWLRRWIGDKRMQIQDPVYQIGFPRFTDADFARAELSRHTQLTVLELSGTNIGDGGMAELKRLKSLRILSLDGTHVTDVGLEDLKGLTGLQHLNLNRTNVTAAGVATLQRALPKLTITSEFSFYGPYPKHGYLRRNAE
jgi:hypothetical protein